MAKTASISIHVADLDEVKQYIRQLEDAVADLAAEMPIPEWNALDEARPRLTEFCRHLHHKLEHEQAMTWRSYWAEQE